MKSDKYPVAINYPMNENSFIQQTDDAQLLENIKVNVKYQK